MIYARPSRINGGGPCGPSPKKWVSFFKKLVLNLESGFGFGACWDRELGYWGLGLLQFLPNYISQTPISKLERDHEMEYMTVWMTMFHSLVRYVFRMYVYFSFKPAGSLYGLLVNSLRPWSASRLGLEILLLTRFVNQGLCRGGLSTWSTCRSKGVTSSSILTRYLSPKPRYPPIDEATQNKPRNKCHSGQK